MIIEQITEAIIHFIETDESCYSFYTRYDKDNWTIRIEESENAVYNCIELEKQFQKMLKEQEEGVKEL